MPEDTPTSELTNWYRFRLNKVQQAFDAVNKEFPAGVDFNDINSNLAARLAEAQAELDEMGAKFNDPHYVGGLSEEDKHKKIQELADKFADSAKEYEDLLAEVKELIPAYKATERYWFNNQNRELLEFKNYEKTLPKRILEDSKISELHEEFVKELHALETIVKSTENLPQETETIKRILKQRKEKVAELNTSLHKRIKIFEEARYKVAAIPKDSTKKETKKQKNERELAEEYEQRTELAEAAVPTSIKEPGATTAYAEDLEKDIYTPVKKDEVKTEVAPQEVLSGGWVRPSFLPPDAAPPSASAPNPSFLGPQDIAFPKVEEKRTEINAKRIEWKQLKEELDSTENEFRTMERERFVQAGKRAVFDKVFVPDPETPEMIAVRDKLCQLKVQYIKNIKENTALRQEEKTLRETAHASTWTPSEPRKEGMNTRPGEKDPELDLQHSFAKRFIVEAAEETLEVKKQVTAEQRSETYKTAAAMIGKLSEWNPLTRTQMKWGGRIVGLVAVSGAAAFMAPAIAGTAAAGAAASYAARLAGGVAGGGLSGYLANKFYGRFTNKAETNFASTKAANVAAFAKNDLSEAAFKAMENTYGSAKENLRVSQRNRKVFTTGATIAGSMGMASLTELGTDLTRSLVASSENYPVPPGADIASPHGEVHPQNLATPDAVATQPTEATAPPFMGPVAVGVSPEGQPLPEVYRPDVRLSLETEELRQAGEAQRQRIERLGQNLDTESADNTAPRSMGPVAVGVSPEGLTTPSGEEMAPPLTAPEAPAQSEPVPVSEAPRSPEMVTIRSGNRLWTLTESRYAGELRGIPPAVRDRVLSEIFNEIQASPEARRLLGIRSGNVHLIYPNENLNFQDIHERLENKLNNYRLRNNLPLPPPPPPLPTFTPVEAAPVRLNIQLPEEIQRGGEVRTQIERLGVHNDNAADTTIVASGIPSRLEVPADPPLPASPSEVPMFREPGIGGVPPPSRYFDVPPPPTTGRLPIIDEGSGNESIQIKVPVEEVKKVVEVAPLLEPSEMTSGRGDLEVPWFARLAEEVYGDVGNFKAARENMINGVVPVYSSWFDSLIGNQQGNLIKFIGDSTLEEFEASATLPRSELLANLQIHHITINAYNKWYQMIDQMTRELNPPSTHLTINELINYYVLLHPDVYRVDPTKQ